MISPCSHRAFAVGLSLLVALFFTPEAQAGGTLASVRVGPHKNFDRMVFEFDRECASFVTAKGNQKIEVLFKNAQTAKTFALPALPPGLVAIKSVDAYRVGDTDIAFEISLARDAAASELPLNGKPWRMAIDLAPKMSQSERDKPEYIPGDQPIQTKFAEAPPPTEKSATPAALDTAAPDHSIDPAKARAVLAYFYLAGGDTPKAQEFAAAYEQLTGEVLDIPLVTSAHSSNSFNGTAQLSAWWMIAFATLAGLIGGIVGSALTTKFATLRRTRSPKPADPRELSQELESNLAALEQTVKAETQPRPAATAPEKVKAQAAAAQAAAAAIPEEEEVKESLIDRRVRRVLELNKQGRPVAEIAAELEMGQDEVKLILDLNS